MSIERNPLPMVSPESVGLDSGAILAYLKKLEHHGHCMHGFIILRHGKIAAEGYYAPHKQEWKHRMYSTSKSFVSVAIGMLQDEGKLSIYDTIASYFPEKLPKDLHPYIARATIRDLLRMSTPFHMTTYKVLQDEDWIRTFFECQPNHLPGQVFNYDTSATTTLTALVEKLSGMEILDYLRSKGFGEMGFSEDAICVKTQDGKVSWAGSGILCTLRDMAKFAQLCLHMGEYEGKQLVSKEYMQEATSKQIENGAYGYGYQFWCGEHGFSCYGMGGQMAYCIPEKDLIFAMTADMQGQPAGYIDWAEHLFYDMVLSGIEEVKKEDPEQLSQLREYCQNLQIAPVSGDKDSAMAALINRKKYVMDDFGPGTPAALHLKSLQVDLEEDQGVLRWEQEEGTYALNFGLGKHIHQNFPGFADKAETEGKPVIIYMDNRSEVPTYLPCITSGAWKSAHELQITCYSIGYYVGTLKINLAFTEDTVTIRMQSFCEGIWTDYNGFQSGFISQ
ncbi:MAG: serine hydrolase [Firmicutes bacterium]|nr:serine hydrolase [Bacillota bacterium]